MHNNIRMWYDAAYCDGIFWSSLSNNDVNRNDIYTIRLQDKNSLCDRIFKEKA